VSLRQNGQVLHIVSVTFPFFALVMCGYAATRVRWLALEAISGLNSFVLFFALPCMLFRFGATTPFEQIMDGGILLTWMFCAVVMTFFAVAMTLNARIRWNDAAFGALVAAFSNTGFMGVPLLLALLGAQAVGPIIVTLMVDMVFTTSLCIGLSRLDGAGQEGLLAAMKKSYKGMLLNPLPWSILLGGAFSMMGWTLSDAWFQTIGLLADAASPTALFAIGAVLARSRMQQASSPQSRPLKAADYLPIVGFKLVLHPLLVLLVGATVIQWGLPLAAPAFTALVLVAALPSASNVSMLAERYGAHTGRIAQIILVTTALSFFSFSAVVHLMLGQT
jgi:predicted permease